MNSAQNSLHEEQLRWHGFGLVGDVDYERDERGEPITHHTRDLTESWCERSELHKFGWGTFFRLTMPAAPEGPAIVALVSDGTVIAVHSVIDAERDLPTWGHITFSDCRRRGGHRNKCRVNCLLGAELGHLAAVQVWVLSRERRFSDVETEYWQEQFLSGGSFPRRRGYDHVSTS